MVNKFIDDTKVKIIINKHTGKATVAMGHQLLFMNQTLYDFFRARLYSEQPNPDFQPLQNLCGGSCSTPLYFDTMFIYCDMLDSRVVGDTTALLLATVPNSNRCLSIGEVVTTRFVKIRYYPVAKRCFQTFRIDAHTDVGKPVGFEGGKVFVELHFRKIISVWSHVYGSFHHGYWPCQLIFQKSSFR